MAARSALLPWVIWILSAIFVVLNYVQQVFPNIIAPEIEGAFHASGGMLGSISAAYFYAYALLQIPVGLIIDRFGTRRPLVAAIFISGLGAVAFAYAGSAQSALAARILMGIGAAFSFLGCLKLVQEWFPPSRFSTLAGMTNTAAMLGAACGAPLAVLVNAVGWRMAAGGTGAVQLILGFLVLLVVRNREVEPKEPTGGSAQTDFRVILMVLRNGQVWVNAVYATTISLIFVAFGGLWGSAFIRKAYGVDAVDAAGISSLLFLGGIAGSLFFGWFSDFLQSRRKPMILAGIGAFLTLIPLIYIPGLPLPLFKAGLFLVGLFSSANIVSYAVARDLYPSFSGLSIGFLSTCFYAGSATSQPLVGLLLEFHSNDRHSTGVDTMTVGDFRYALSSLVFFMIVSIVCSFLIRETIQPAERNAVS